MSRTQIIAIVVVVLIAGLLISGVLIYMNMVRKQSEKVEFLHNLDEKPYTTKVLVTVLKLIITESFRFQS